MGAVSGRSVFLARLRARFRVYFTVSNSKVIKLGATSCEDLLRYSKDAGRGRPSLTDDETPIDVIVWRMLLVRHQNGTPWRSWRARERHDKRGCERSAMNDAMWGACRGTVPFGGLFLLPSLWCSLHRSKIIRQINPTPVNDRAALYSTTRAIRGSARWV